jgi:hypothetical protein
MNDWQQLKNELRFWFELTGIPTTWRKLKRERRRIIQTGDPIDTPDLDL